MSFSNALLEQGFIISTFYVLLYVVLVCCFRPSSFFGIEGWHEEVTFRVIRQIYQDRARKSGSIFQISHE